MTQTTPHPSGAARGTPDGWTHRVLSALGRAEMAVGCVALTLIFVLVLLQAAQRYAPWDSFPWTGELSRFCLVWLTFSVLGLLLTRDEHLALQLADQIPSPTVVKAVHVLALLVVAAVSVGGVAEAVNLVEVQHVLRSPAMGMRMSWLYAIPLLGFASTAVRALVAAVDVLRFGPRLPEPDEETPGLEGRAFE